MKGVRKVEDKENTFDDLDAVQGVIVKSASIKPMVASDEDLKKINKYTLEPLKAEDVFVFKSTIADNEQDDRNDMPFNLKALKDMKKLYVGKTMLKDHNRKADNQIARIFDTELIQNENKTTELGEIHTELEAKCYMVVTESNKDLIAEIKGGIKKEVSTSTAPEKMVCNICGTDNMKEYCRHYPSREYTIDDGTAKGKKRRCKMLLDGVKEAYELSFVTVPAQPRAGTHKSVGFNKPFKEPTEKQKNEKESIEKTDLRFLTQRVKNAQSFFNAENEREVPKHE